MADEFPVKPGPEPEKVTQVTGFSTDDGGKQPETVDKILDPVKAALARAQRISRSRPGRPRRRRDDADSGADAARGGYSGAWPDATDPSTLGAVAADFVADRGWQRPLSEARVFSAWAEIVGADVAAHCAPSGLRDGELRVSAESTAWATQLRLLSGTVLAKLVAHLGPDVVTKLHISGPTGPSWKHGAWSVRGRGPRDTYG